MNREWFKNRANQKFGVRKMSDKCKNYIDTDEVNKENTEKGLNKFCVDSIIILMDIMFEMKKRLNELEKLIIKEDNNNDL